MAYRLLPLGGGTTGLHVVYFAVLSVRNPSMFPGLDETTDEQRSLAGHAYSTRSS
jgi:hypothetical protein